MMHLLVSLLTLIAIMIAAFGLGRPLLRGVGVSEEDALSSVVFSTGVGLLIVGLFLLALGQVGVLSVSVIGLATLPCCCWGLAEIGILCLHPSRRSSVVFQRLPDQLTVQVNHPWPEPSRWLLGACFSAACIGYSASFVNAFAPWTTDVAFCGPLEAAKRYLVEQRVDVPFACGPWLIEMWYVWALALGDNLSVQLIPWWLGILSSLGAVTLATPLVGHRWAWLAGCFVMLTPAINQQLNIPVERTALAVFCTLALTAWWQAACHGGDQRWFIVAGLMAGSAWGIGNWAFFVILAVVATWAWSVFHYTEQRRFLMQGGAIALAVAVGVGVLCRLPALWTGRFLGEWSFSPTWSFSVFNSWGLLLSAVVPGIFLVRKLRGLGFVLWTALIVLFFTALAGGDAMQSVATIPLLSVAAVWVVIELGRFPRAARWVAAASLAVLMLCDMALPIVKMWDVAPLALGYDDREEFLLQREPTYRAAAVANRILRPDDHILSQERPSFYFNCRVTPEALLNRSLNGESLSCSTREAVERLRHEGYTHLLLMKNIAGGESMNVSPLHRLADAGLTLTDYDFRTADGSVRRYRLVQLR